MYVLTQRLKYTPAGRTILNKCYTDTVERIDGYILEQSVSVRAVPELIIGETGAAVDLFLQSLVAVLLTSDPTMLKCIRKQKLIKICHVV